MSGEIQQPMLESGLDLVAHLVYHDARRWRYGAVNALEVFSQVTFDAEEYDTDIDEQGTSALYVGDMPAGAPSGRWTVLFYHRATMGFAERQVIDWDGTGVLNFAEMEAELSEESVTDLAAGVVADVSMAAMIATVGRIDRSSKTVIQGTVGVGSTQTQIVVSTIDPLLTVANQLKGLVMKFAKDTTTPALRGQGTEITGNSVGGPIVVTALTTAPVSGDSFVIE